MVVSHIIAVTPAQHADEHRAGGTDPLTGAVGIDELNVYELSDTVLYSNDTEKTDSTGDGAYHKVKEMLLINTVNILRTAFFLEADTGDVVEGRIYRNGIAVGTERTENDVGLEYIEDISGWSDGDLYQIYVKTGAGEMGKAKNQRILGTWQIGKMSTPTNQDP